MARFSRLESAEEKRNFRSAAVLFAVSVLVVIFLFVYGIPAVGKIANFVSSLKGGDSTGINDKTPPAPPTFNYFPDFTNQQIFSVSGSAEPGATIKLIFNGKSQETLVSKDGNFVFQGLNLKEGENKFSATAIDSSGNISLKSADKTTVYDPLPPDVTIDSPQDGSKFYGSTQRQINISGTTEASANVTINDRFVTLDSNGKFQYPVTLNSGDNVFFVKVTDSAGNTTQKDFTVVFVE